MSTEDNKVNKIKLIEQKNQGEDEKRKPYKKPYLEILGDLRTVTLGASIGSGDSATDPFNFEAFT